MPKLRSVVPSLINLVVVLGLLTACSRQRRRSPIDDVTVTATQAANATQASPEAATQAVPSATSEPLGTPVAGPDPTQPVATPDGAAGASDPAFGVLAIIPGSSGSTSDPAAISAIANAGARYMRTNLSWSDFEPSPGSLSFDTPRDRTIAEIEAAGLRLFPTLSVGRGWMNGDPPGAVVGGSQSYPPDDLEMVWSDEYGYSRGYYNFVYQLVSRYRGHFNYVAVENEANSKLFWGGTAEDYVRLAKTAYKAIKAADPSVRVVDSGAVSTLWGFCMVDDYLQSGAMSRDQALRLGVGYFAAETRTGKIEIRSAQDLERLLGDPRIQEQCRRLNHMLDNLGGSVDGINFHFYEDYQVMREVVDWIRLRTGRAGYSPAVVSNELGQRGPDIAYAGGTDHAQAVFKKLVTASTLGMEAAIWFSGDTIGNPLAASPDKVGLFGEDGAMRPAAETFRLVAATLGAGYRFRSAPSMGPSLFEYTFDDASGNPTLEALWAEGGGQVVTLTAPAGSSQAVLIQHTGQTQTLPVTQGSITVDLAGGPVFVQWH